MRLECFKGGGVPGTGSGKGVFLKGRWSRASREGRGWRRYRKKEGGKLHEVTQNWGCRRHLGWGQTTRGWLGVGSYLVLSAALWELRAALGKEAEKQLGMQKASVDVGKAWPSLRLWGDAAGCIWLRGCFSCTY